MSDYDALFDKYGLTTECYFNDLATMKDKHKIRNSLWRIEDKTAQMLDNNESVGYVRIGASIKANFECDGESIVVRFERYDDKFISEIGIALIGCNAEDID